MRRSVLAVAVLGLACGALVLMFGVSAGDASVNVSIAPPPPIVLVAPPPLVVVPAVPAVSYAPSAQVDLFFFDQRWYYPHGGHWYVGPSHKGPWTVVAVGKLPHAIVAVPVRYYKVPPGHLKKVGNGGPPGHAKGKGRGHP